MVYVKGNYNKLRQLLLIEEFKNCVPGNSWTYIDERKADTLNQAAVLADDYTLTHKTSFSRSSSQDHLKTKVDSSSSNPHKMNGRKEYRKYNSFSGGNRAGLIPPGPECHSVKRRDT